MTPEQRNAYAKKLAEDEAAYACHMSDLGAYEEEEVQKPKLKSASRKRRSGDEQKISECVLMPQILSVTPAQVCARVRSSPVWGSRVLESVA